MSSQEAVAFDNKFKLTGRANLVLNGMLPLTHDKVSELTRQLKAAGLTELAEKVAKV